MIYVLSGGTKLFAAIGVTYPEGSTCTCTNGTKTLKAKNTSGQWVFAIPEAGTWTVVAGSKSKKVSINTEGQCEIVNLAETVLWEAGTEYNTNITGGFEVGNASYTTVGNTITITGNRTYFGDGSAIWSYGGNYYTSQKVSTGDFEYFCVNVIKNSNAASNASNRAWLYAANAYNFTENDTIARLEIPVTTGQVGVFKMPLNGVGSAVLGVRVYGANSLQTIEIDKIWLE